GFDMMKEACLAFREVNSTGKIIAVTQLTSTSEATMQKEQATNLSMTDSVLHYAELAYKAGLDGVVSSPLESRLIHNEIDSEFLNTRACICSSAYEAYDYILIVKPFSARVLGSEYIVVSSPITRSDRPIQAYKEIK